jgi:hypothetical protein
METLYALVVALAFVSFTALVGFMLQDMKKMRKMNGILMEILRSNSIRRRYPWDFGMGEFKRKAG